MKVKLGPIIGQASGAVGAQVFSHNRYGAYTRNRTIPVTSTTAPALNAKARLSLYSAGWQALTAEQRLQWKEWANQNPIVDRLGDRQILTGHAAYVKINTRMNLAGLTALTSPGVGAHPAALTTVASEFDIGAGDFEINYTPTPIGATNHIWLESAVVDSVAINYVQNLKRWITASAANAASPLSPQAAIEAIFGTLVPGQKVVHFVYVFDATTGLLSVPVRSEGTVVTT